MSHNSDEAAVTPGAAEQPDLPFRLTGSQAKTAFALRHNLERMIVEAGIECVGFLTLTVGDSGSEGFAQVWDAAEASRRINNLNRRILADLFEKWVVVTERHKNGAIHFHLVGVLRGKPDVRTGFDFDAVSKGDYRSVSPHLRALWGHLRETLPLYGFGRSELTPIRKTGEAVACYVSKYVEKNLFNRLEEDKGRKLVRYCGWDGAQLRPNDFGWATPRATAWRNKARDLAALAGVNDRAEVAQAFGPKWAYRLTKIMAVVDDRPLPSFEWNYAERECARRLVRREAGKAWISRRDFQNKAGPKVARGIGTDTIEPPVRHWWEPFNDVPRGTQPTKKAA